MADLRIAVLGAAGRMGKTVLTLATAQAGLEVAGAWVQAADNVAGKVVSDWAPADCGVVATTDLAEALAGADVAVDFTLPTATAAVLGAVEASSIALVSGTTGLDSPLVEQMRRAAETIPIVYDRNMSAGVHVLTELARRAAELLNDDYDIEIIEAHHRRKVDAPSGTALKLGEAVAAARDTDLTTSGVFTRHGVTGVRPDGAIGFSTVRGGGIVGEHTVLYAGENESVALVHTAGSRDVFADGALRAARWIAGKPAGLYGLPDVLGISC